MASCLALVFSAILISTRSEAWADSGMLVRTAGSELLLQRPTDTPTIPAHFANIPPQSVYEGWLVQPGSATLLEVSQRSTEGQIGDVDDTSPGVRLHHASGVVEEATLKSDIKVGDTIEVPAHTQASVLLYKGRGVHLHPPASNAAYLILANKDAVYFVNQLEPNSSSGFIVLPNDPSKDVFWTPCRHSPLCTRFLDARDPSVFGGVQVSSSAPVSNPPSLPLSGTFAWPTLRSLMPSEETVAFFRSLRSPALLAWEALRNAVPNVAAEWDRWNRSDVNVQSISLERMYPQHRAVATSINRSLLELRSFDGERDDTYYPRVLNELGALARTIDSNDRISFGARQWGKLEAQQIRREVLAFQSLDTVVPPSDTREKWSDRLRYLTVRLQPFLAIPNDSPE